MQVSLRVERGARTGLRKKKDVRYQNVLDYGAKVQAKNIDLVIGDNYVTRRPQGARHHIW